MSRSIEALSGESRVVNSFRSNSINGARLKTGGRRNGAAFGEQAENGLLAVGDGQDVSDARAHQAGDAGERRELDELLPHVLHDGFAGTHVDAGDLEQRLQPERTFAQRTLDFAENDRLVGHELNDPALRIEPRTDIRESAEDASGAEPGGESVDVFQPVQDRQNHRVGADGGRKLAHRVIERVGFHADEHDVEGLPEIAGQNDLRLHHEVAVRAHDLQSVPPQLLGPLLAHQEGHVAACSDEASAVIASERPCADHQHSHSNSHCMRRPFSHCPAGTAS